jgi:F-type H+-transporting ATPase subunit delta
MATDMIIHHSPVALTYAQALLELAGDQKQAEAVGEELRQLGQLLDQQESLRLFLADPAIAHLQRQALLEHVFKERLSPLVYAFLGVMNVKGRLRFLRQAIAAYADLLDEKMGKVEVDLTVAHELSVQEMESVRQRISQALGKQVNFRRHVDPDIIGGLVLRVQDQLLDASVRSQLDAMKEKMLAARVAAKLSV